MLIILRKLPLSPSEGTRFAVNLSLGNAPSVSSKVVPNTVTGPVGG
ncbi:Uncharacterised protein [Vibrio cholerae]|nr:Uncharacterised protein [Vibrio cholerae]